MELSDRDRMLLAFANLASHGIAARPAMASDAAELAADRVTRAASPRPPLVRLLAPQRRCVL
jgi:hypothetical protein